MIRKSELRGPQEDPELAKQFFSLLQTVLLHRPVMLITSTVFPLIFDLGIACLPISDPSSSLNVISFMKSLMETLRGDIDDHLKDILENKIREEGYRLTRGVLLSILDVNGMPLQSVVHACFILAPLLGAKYKPFLSECLFNVLIDSERAIPIEIKDENKRKFMDVVVGFMDPYDPSQPDYINLTRKLKWQKVVSILSKASRGVQVHDFAFEDELM
jgi:hypothetical protein